MLRTPDGICPVSAASREVVEFSVLAAFATQKQLLANRVQETVLRRLMKRRVFGIDARASKLAPAVTWAAACPVSTFLVASRRPR